jgi:multidrug efflux pump subunit AcrA (membrane-fusion protein)
MASKDLKPKTRLGGSHPGRVKAVVWAVVLLGFGGGSYAAFRYTGTTEVEVPVARVRRGDFVVSVRTRGDIKSAKSTILKAPQVPGLRITRLAPNGRPVAKGDVVVEFDAVSQEQVVISRTTNVQAVDGNIVQMKATQRMNDGQDALTKMTSEYALERAKLDASKAEVLSAIDGEKNRIQVGVSEGALQQVKAQINAHQVGNEADLGRVGQQKDKAQRDLETAQKYLSLMQLRAPTDGVVNVLPNFRAQGTFGQSQPPFKEGDNAWTGAEIVEIPDLSQLYIDLRLEEVDRGRIQLGQSVKIRVDAIPDKEFSAELDYVSPIAALVFKGGSTPEKTFPARATLKSLDPRLRPGMSASAEIIIEKEPSQLLIPARASFDKEGKPAVYVQTGKDFVVRNVQIGNRNDEEIVIAGGLKEGEIVALENPVEAAKKAKKKKL